MLSTPLAFMYHLIPLANEGEANRASDNTSRAVALGHPTERQDDLSDGRESGVAHPVILRFMSGERDIRLETAEKLAATLGLELRKCSNKNARVGCNRPGQPQPGFRQIAALAPAL